MERRREALSDPTAAWQAGMQPCAQTRTQARAGAAPEES